MLSIAAMETAQLMPTAPTTPLGQWTLVLGFVMPLLIAIIQHCNWPKNVKAFIAFMACLSAAAIQLGIEGKFSAGNWAQSGLSVAALCIAFFHGFWKPLGVADAVEKATSLNVSSTPNDSHPKHTPRYGEHLGKQDGERDYIYDIESGRRKPK